MAPQLFWFTRYSPLKYAQSLEYYLKAKLIMMAASFSLMLNPFITNSNNSIRTHSLNLTFATEHLWLIFDLVLHYKHVI